MSKRTRARDVLFFYITDALEISPHSERGADVMGELDMCINLIIGAAKEEILAELMQQAEDENIGSYAEYKQRYGSGLKGD